MLEGLASSFSLFFTYVQALGRGYRWRGQLPIGCDVRRAKVHIYYGCVWHLFGHIQFLPGMEGASVLETLHLVASMCVYVCVCKAII
jgi:hypothetical protein